MLFLRFVDTICSGFNLILFCFENVPAMLSHVSLLQDAETVEKLNETGELRRILKPYKVSE